MSLITSYDGSHGMDSHAHSVGLWITTMSASLRDWTRQSKTKPESEDDGQCSHPNLDTWLSLQLSCRSYQFVLNLKNRKRFLCREKILVMVFYLNLLSDWRKEYCWLDWWIQHFMKLELTRDWQKVTSMILDIRMAHKDTPRSVCI